ncbi:MAG: transcription antitermination factor NusB [Bacteroidales bacterium]|nr:transcription antitermination factor NusB [Bacteroidales bacterium]
MLTRRDLRMKVLQSLYATEISSMNQLQEAENQLIKSTESIYDLFIYQLSFILEMSEYAQNKMEENKQKQLPTLEDLHPNTRFWNNPFLQIVWENKQLQKEIERLNIHWDNYPELFRDIYNNFKNSDEYKQYSAIETKNFKQARHITTFFYTDFILPNTTLEGIYEEKQLHWNSDLLIAAFLVVQYFESINTSTSPDEALPPLLKTSQEDGNFDVEDDRTFMCNLLRKVIIHNEEYDQILSSHIKNWDYDRVAKIDILILKMALAELLEFPTIPIKVTINEYIEIAKAFSTPKSNIFINGLLDSLIREFKEQGKIKKLGRGLFDGKEKKTTVEK